MAETLDIRALKLIESRMADEISRREMALGDGAASSYDDYRYRVGMIQAFKIVEEMLGEIEQSLYGGNER